MATVVTSITNTSGRRKWFSFLPPNGAWLDAGATVSVPGIFETFLFATDAAALTSYRQALRVGDVGATRNLPDTVFPSAIVLAADPSSVPLTLQGVSSQTANLLELKAYGGGVVMSVDPAGVVTGDGSNLTNVAILNGANVFTGSNQFKQVTELVNALGSISGPVSVDLTLGNVVTATIAGPTTLTIIGVAVGGGCSTVTFVLTNAGANITWSSVPKWSGGIPPVLSNVGVDIIVMTTVDNGATWYATPSIVGAA